MRAGAPRRRDVAVHGALRKSRPCFGLVELCGVSRVVLRPEGGLVLQGSTAGKKGVLEVVVEETADGGHVDVSKARQSARELRDDGTRPPAIDHSRSVMSWPFEELLQTDAACFLTVDCCGSSWPTPKCIVLKFRFHKQDRNGRLCKP
ncbi:hypothetical protein INR49_017547 [Caranx melampygus]|nr:hypothetical protein INR49_017547 [Caranx melampygus]